MDGLDGWMDTPLTVMTTRAPAVLKSESSFLNITCPRGLSLLSLFWQRFSTFFGSSEVSMLSKTCIVF